MSGDDVYTAGNEYKNDTISVAKYWKNSSPVILTDGSKSAVASSIFVTIK